MSTQRVLVVCDGNTCRSPVLSFLLEFEFYLKGQRDIEVHSAGHSEPLPTDPVGRMNAFAKAALREILLTRRGDASVDATMLRAETHHHKGLSFYQGQSFDLILIFDHTYEQTLKERRISGPIQVQECADTAWGVWDSLGRPVSIEDDQSGRVLGAYREQTGHLLEHAQQVVAHEGFR